MGPGGWTDRHTHTHTHRNKTMGELTFSFWNATSGLAFSDISLATETHLEGQRKEEEDRGGGAGRLEGVGREGLGGGIVD